MNKEKIGRAIKTLRKERKMSQEDIAQKLGIDTGNVSRYETGKQGLEFDRLILLAETLGVKPSDIFKLAESGSDSGNITDAPELHGKVPLISWVQAGNWCEIAEGIDYQQLEFISTTYKTREFSYALRVVGDSMEPKFPNGSIIIVEPEEQAHHNSYVIAVCNGEATFKQLVLDGMTSYLKPLNDRYPIMAMPPDTRICGVVKRVEMDV